MPISWYPQRGSSSGFFRGTILRVAFAVRFWVETIFSGSLNLSWSRWAWSGSAQQCSQHPLQRSFKERMSHSVGKIKNVKNGLLKWMKATFNFLCVWICTFSFWQKIKCHTQEKREKKEWFFFDSDANFLPTGAVLRKVNVMLVAWCWLFWTAPPKETTWSHVQQIPVTFVWPCIFSTVMFLTVQN